MLKIDRDAPTLGPVLALAGFLCSIFGGFIFSIRQSFAATFLGADFLFGLPLTQSDSYKVIWVASQGLMAIVCGIMLLISGVVIAFIHSSRKGHVAGASEPVPTNR